MGKRLSSCCALAATALAFAAAGKAAPGLLVGVADNYLKSEPAAAADALRMAGAGGVRLVVVWNPGQSSLPADEVAALQRALGAVPGGVKVVVAVQGVASAAPNTAEARDQFCSYAAHLVRSFPQINDVAIWNEPNTTWIPQFAGDGSSHAPGAYAALLARCYDVLHELRPGINVIHAGLASRGNDRAHATSNVSHSPGNFIRQEGLALRSGKLGSGRGAYFDTFALHPYGEDSSDPVAKRHDASSTIAMGDWGKLMQALVDAFDGTGQRTPPKGLPVWYLENGFQTVPAADKASLYFGGETDPAPLPAVGEPSQASQLAAAVKLAYCQPYITAYFSFLLRDEPDLHGWQSGLMWRDWTPKGSLAVFRAAIDAARAGTIDCASVPGGPFAPFAAKSGVEVEQVLWSKARSFNWRNDLWRFRIQTGEDASYTASLVGLGGGARAAAATRGVVMTTSGELRKLYLTMVKFDARLLAPGRYRYEIRLSSKESAGRTSVLKSPVFVVRPRAG